MAPEGRGGGSPGKVLALHTRAAELQPHSAILLQSWYDGARVIPALVGQRKAVLRGSQARHSRSVRDSDSKHKVPEE